MKTPLLLLLTASLCAQVFTLQAQVQVPSLSAQPGSTQDNSLAAITKPAAFYLSVAALPSTCTISSLAWVLNTTAGQNLYGCTSANTWTLEAGGGGGSGTPGGSNTQLQYNNSGAFGGIVGVTWNGTTLTIVPPTQFNGNVTSGNVAIDFSAASSISLIPAFMRTDTGFVMSAGQKGVFTPSSTSAGLRVVCNSLPSVPIGGDLVHDAVCTPGDNNGSIYTSFARFAGNASGYLGTTPGDLVKISDATGLLADYGSAVLAVVNGGTNTASPGFAAQTDGATVTWALGSALVANATLTFTTHGGSRTLNITNPVSGGYYTLKLVQDGTGGEGLTLGTGCAWKVSGGGSGAITPSTGAGAVDVLAVVYDGANCLANFNKLFN